VGIELRRVSKHFGHGSSVVVALDAVTLSVADHELVSVVGPSGCGKSTLLRIIAGLVAPSSGTVAVGPETAGKPRAALVFQEHGLLPWCTVLENVALGLEFAGEPRAAREAVALELIRQVGLAEFTRSYPHQLSVGMRQRVAIARGFATNAEVLLLDEPFGSLDAQTRLVLQEELLRTWRDHRKTVVHVTHDIDEAVMLADRVVVLSGRPGRVLHDIPVPLPRPRTLADCDSGEVTAIKVQIWNALEREVRTLLHLP
jgi:NitT/TauT family transport system ATP-binding protein